jgi:hypothetical protein
MPRAEASKSSKPVAPPPRRKRDGTPSRPKNIAEVRSRGMQTTKHTAEDIDPNKPVTAGQRAFVMYWAQGDTIINATIRAGYDTSPTYGYRMARQPNILALYKAEKAKYEESVQMTRKKVMEGFLDGIAMAKLEGNSASVIAGWREVGKMCGYYEPITRKVELTVNGTVMLERMNRLSDAELLKMIQSDVVALIEQDEEETTPE